MRRRSAGFLVAIVLGAVLWSALAAVSASASGGGCYRPATNGGGVTAEIRALCFRPSTLHVRLGGEVTWANRDSVQHTVTGANQSWGDSTTLKPGQTLTVLFTRPGVYPYFCYYHLGMVGAVVVGGGRGPGAAEHNGVTIRPVTVAPSAAPVIVAGSPQTVLGGAAKPEPPGGTTAAWWILGGLLGVVTAGAGVATRRRSRSS